MPVEFSSKLSAYVCSELEILTAGIMFEAGEPEKIDIYESLVDLGFDSITLLELLEKVNQRFSIEVSLLVITDFPSLAQLAGYIVDVHGKEVASALPLSDASGVEPGYV